MSGEAGCWVKKQVVQQDHGLLFCSQETGMVERSVLGEGMACFPDAPQYSSSSKALMRGPIPPGAFPGGWPHVSSFGPSEVWPDWPLGTSCPPKWGLCSSRVMLGTCCMAGGPACGLTGLSVSRVAEKHPHQRPATCPLPCVSV